MGMFIQMQKEFRTAPITITIALLGFLGASAMFLRDTLEPVDALYAHTFSVGDDAHAVIRMVLANHGRRDALVYGASLSAGNNDRHLPLAKATTDNPLPFTIAPGQLRVIGFTLPSLEDLKGISAYMTDGRVSLYTLLDVVDGVGRHYVPLFRIAVLTRHVDGTWGSAVPAQRVNLFASLEELDALR